MKETSFTIGLDFLEDLSSNYENALLLSGFGKFHLMLLTICGLIYMNTAVGVTILSFVLPSATCDFQMTSEDKGWLSATPMLGMLIGSYFWGCLADTKGRRIVLVATLIADGVCGLLSSIAPYYLLFLLIRFFNGFNVAGTMGIVFPYLGEFQPTKYREKILCWMELFWTFGIIMLPESDKALEILVHIFVKNTGQKPEEYACKSLRGPIRSGKSVRSLRLHNPNELKELLAEIWSQTKTLYKKPYLRNNSITCGIQFCLTTSYYTLMVWFPELFQRFDEFEKQYPDVSASVCGVSSIVVSNSTVIPCDQNIDEKVFFHTIIIGLACIPTSFWLPLCVHRLGIKFFLVFSLTAAGFVTIGLYFVRNSLENLILSCIFEALTSLSISTVYCVMVDLFPTNLRVMAAAMSMTFGRSGALLVSAFLCWLLPNTGSEALE
uniref:Major facilitator superfamily (MFS) profile domain-containing protein n=1 Tax=Glossina austeni TaxID=7395 RepID=A0A1A9VFU3_GLOAU